MNETTSQLSYRPSSLNEELTIECWANNSAYINSSVHEPEPCVFHIEPYGKCCGCWLHILSYSMYLYVASKNKAAGKLLQVICETVFNTVRFFYAR